MAQEIVEAGKTIEVDGEEQHVTAKVFYDAGSNLDDAVDKYGEDLVFGLYKSEMFKKLKSAIRRELNSGTPPDQVPDRLSNWRPDKPHHVAKNPEQAGLDAFDQMTPEQQQEHLEKIRRKLQEAGVV